MYNLPISTKQILQLFFMMGRGVDCGCKKIGVGNISFHNIMGVSMDMVFSLFQYCQSVV